MSAPARSRRGLLLFLPARPALNRPRRGDAGHVVGSPRALSRRAAAGLAVATALVAASPVAASVRQSWAEQSVTVSLGDSSWSLAVTSEQRSRDLDYGEVFLRNWSAGARRSLPRRFWIGASFKVEVEERSGRPEVTEERYVLDSGWQRTVSPRWRFDLRLRNEFRTFDQPGLGDKLRVRLRFRLRSQRKLGRIEVRPYVWTELFETVSDARGTLVERNRLGLGLSVPIGSSVSLAIHYLRQDTRGRPPLNGYVTGLHLAF